jgi:ketosteroid isomerase-like protein
MQGQEVDLKRLMLLTVLSFVTPWAASAGTTDVERIVSFWTDDAVIYPPRQAPVAGKAAIRKYVGDSMKIPGFSVSWKPAAAVVSASGDLGYTTGTNSSPFPTTRAGPRPRTADT